MATHATHATLLLFALLTLAHAAFRIDTISNLLSRGHVGGGMDGRGLPAVQAFMDHNPVVASIPVVLANRVFYFDVSMVLKNRLESRSLSLPEQESIIRDLQVSMNSSAWYTTRALEDLLPTQDIIRYSHIEIILEHQGDNGQSLLRQLYLDVRATDDVDRLTVAACGELGFPTHAGCIDYVHSEILRTITFPLNYSDAATAFSPKAHYDPSALPSCVLLREGFDSRLVMSRPKIRTTLASAPDAQHGKHDSEDVVVNGA